MTDSAQQWIRYGAAVGFAIVLMAGAVYLADRDERASEPAVASADRPPPAAPPQLATKPTAVLDGADLPSAAETDRVARLLGEARRLAYDGNFTEAKAALDKAEAIIPGSVEIAETRREIAAISTPDAQLAVQIERAKSAIALADRAGAEEALAAAERINPQAPEIAQLRQTLHDDEQKRAERSHRIAGLLMEMRQAIARRDFAAAARALNEAERLDVRDPAIDSARLDLARAQDSQPNSQPKREREQ